VELSRILARLRLQLALERTAQLTTRGIFASGLALVGVAGCAWFIEIRPLAVWVAAGPLLAAVVVAIARWPSIVQAAVVADRQFNLHERLATAAELVGRPSPGRYDGLQVGDALACAQRLAKGWMSFDPRARYEVFAAAAALVLGLVLLALAPARPHSFGSGVPPFSQAAAATSADLALRRLPADSPTEAPAVDAQPIKVVQPDPGLARRVQQQQAEQSALGDLSDALRSISAGQPIADAIRQGDFNSASEQLQNLADQADQLSDAAKQQLSNALQQAATTSQQTDRQLSDKERQAARALGRPGYNEQRQALRSLADQVQRSGGQSVSSDRLQREVGQLQQQASAQGSTSAPGPTSPTSPASPASSRGPAQSGGGSEGQQGGPGIGTGPGPDLFGDKPSGLDSAGQTVEVPVQLGSGPGVRPTDGNEDQFTANPSLGGRNVAELSRAQQTGQVAPEQNLVPGDQRPVVRGYFR
jgi:hypothetical protein